MDLYAPEIVWIERSDPEAAIGCLRESICIMHACERWRQRLAKSRFSPPPYWRFKRLFVVSLSWRRSPNPSARGFGEPSLTRLPSFAFLPRLDNNGQRCGLPGRVILRRESAVGDAVPTLAKKRGTSDFGRYQARIEAVSRGSSPWTCCALHTVPIGHLTELIACIALT